MSVETVLALLAAVLGVIAIFEANGKSWTGWAVLLLAAIHVLL